MDEITNKSILTAVCFTLQAQAALGWPVQSDTVFEWVAESLLVLVHGHVDGCAVTMTMETRESESGASDEDIVILTIDRHGIACRCSNAGALALRLRAQAWLEQPNHNVILPHIMSLVVGGAKIAGVLDALEKGAKHDRNPSTPS